MNEKNSTDCLMGQALKEIEDHVNSLNENPFHIDPEKLIDVINGLRKQDIPDCQPTSVEHVDRLLTIILSTCRMGSDVFDQAIGFYGQIYREYYHQAFDQFFQEFANRNGFGEECAAVILAKKQPKMKDHHLAVVEMLMKSHGVSQNRAINMLGEEAGVDPDDFRRTVTRQKKRKKKART